MLSPSHSAQAATRAKGDARANELGGGLAAARAQSAEATAVHEPAAAALNDNVAAVCTAAAQLQQQLDMAAQEVEALRGRLKAAQDSKVGGRMWCAGGADRCMEAASNCLRHEPLMACLQPSVALPRGSLMTCMPLPWTCAQDELEGNLKGAEEALAEAAQEQGSIKVGERGRSRSACCCRMHHCAAAVLGVRGWWCILLQLHSLLLSSALAMAQPHPGTALPASTVHPTCRPSPI